MRNSLLAVILCAMVSPAFTFDWQFEQVDTVGNWSSPSLRLSGTGVLHFCYREPGNRVVHSYLDSVWHREEVVPPDTLKAYYMDAGPHGEFGLVVSLPDGYWLYEKQDTSWQRDSVPVPLWYFRYDSAGAPSGVSMIADTIRYSMRAQSTWVSETVLVKPMGYSYSCGPLTYTARGEPCVVVSGGDYSYLYKFIRLYIEQADTWRASDAASGGRRSTLGYVGLAPDTGGGAVVLYTYSDEFQFTPLFRLSGYGTVDSSVSAGAVVVHGSGVPHVAYIRNQLRYACRVGTTWYHDTVSTASGLLIAGVVLEDSLPVIGFVDPATGVWIARRQPVGVEETQPFVPVSLQPTIIRGVLFPSEAASHKPQATSLLDISGRKVMDLHEGPNDVRALAPGVYFVREAQAQAQAQAIRKVVLTK